MKQNKKRKEKSFYHHGKDGRTIIGGKTSIIKKHAGIMWGKQ